MLNKKLKGNSNFTNIFCHHYLLLLLFKIIIVFLGMNDESIPLCNEEVNFDYC